APARRRPCCPPCSRSLAEPRKPSRLCSKATASMKAMANSSCAVKSPSAARVASSSTISPQPSVYCASSPPTSPQFTPRTKPPPLATIHAQNEPLPSFDAAPRLALLDMYAGVALDPVREAFSHWKSVAERIRDLQQGEQDRLRLLDLWTFQKREIEEVKPQAG